MKKQQQQLREKLRRNGLDAVLLTGGVSIRYFTGFTSDECIVLLTQTDCTLVTDFRYTIQAKAQTGAAAKVVERNGAAEQMKVMRDLLIEHGCRVVGFEDAAMTVTSFCEFEKLPVRLVPFSEQLNPLRIVKSSQEVELLQKAQSMADAAFAQLVNDLKPGMTEQEVAARLTYLCACQGSEGPAFDPIVGSGPNGAMCHAIPGQRKLQKGDFVVFDFGCTYGGYRSDMTRTVCIGAADEEMKKVYAIVLESQLRALRILKAGVSGRALDAAARDYIKAEGYGDYFGHGLGHGFGLEIHEPPRAALTSCDTLLSGMTITVEPGIYLPDKFGVRIEDCCVVTDTGCLNLVSTAKDLLIV